MTTKWKMRGQALRDGKPKLSLKPPLQGPPHIGRPVPKGFRGTEMRDRNPMFDHEALPQDDRGEDSIRAQLVQRGIR